MSGSSVGALIGNPRPRSRTLQVGLRARDGIVTALRAAAPGRAWAAGDVLDAATLAHQVFGEQSDAVARRVAQVASQRVVVVATSTYKATYTGLLKSVLDLSPPSIWEQTVAIPVQVVGSHRHTLAADVHLRPLLVELGASTPTSSIVVAESDLRADEGAGVVEAWLAAEAGGRALVRAVAAGNPPSAGEGAAAGGLSPRSEPATWRRTQQVGAR